MHIIAVIFGVLVVLMFGSLTMATITSNRWLPSREIRRGHRGSHRRRQRLRDLRRAMNDLQPISAGEPILALAYGQTHAVADAWAILYPSKEVACHARR
jgi:hypothetical protein